MQQVRQTRQTELMPRSVPLDMRASFCVNGYSELFTIPATFTITLVIANMSTHCDYQVNKLLANRGTLTYLGNLYWFAVR